MIKFDDDSVHLHDPYSIYYHALNDIGGRWSKGEEILKNYPYNAINYARDVIGGRWIEAEPKIMSDPDCAKIYIDFVLNDDKISPQVKTLFQLQYSEYLK